MMKYITSRHKTMFITQKDRIVHSFHLNALQNCHFERKKTPLQKDFFFMTLKERYKRFKAWQINPYDWSSDENEQSIEQAHPLSRLIAFLSKSKTELALNSITKNGGWFTAKVNQPLRLDGSSAD